MAFNFDKTFEVSRKMYASVLMDKNIGIPVRIGKDQNRLTKTLAKESGSVRINNEILQYCLQATFLIDVEITQGEFIEIFDLGTTILIDSIPTEKGIVFSTVSQDPVSKICSIIKFNNEVSRTRDTDTYNDAGELLVTTSHLVNNIPVYIEESGYKSVDSTIGQIRDITAKLYAHKDADLHIQDIITLNGITYRIDSIDDIRMNNLIIADVSKYLE